jgi:hypothetical protein
MSRWVSAAVSVVVAVGELDYFDYSEYFLDYYWIATA